MNVIEKLKIAFPARFKEMAIYTAFNISNKATIYVDHNNNNIAKIRTTCFCNFQNGHKIKEYINIHKLPTRDNKSHPDAYIDIYHIDNIINIIKGVYMTNAISSKKIY